MEAEVVRGTKGRDEAQMGEPWTGVEDHLKAGEEGEEEQENAKEVATIGSPKRPQPSYPKHFDFGVNPLLQLNSILIHFSHNVNIASEILSTDPCGVG